MKVSIEKIRWLAAGLLEMNGCPSDIAQNVAEHMVEADRNGYSSHGVSLLPKYIGNMHEGEVTAVARPELLAESSGMMRFHARNAFGQHAAKVAMRAAIEKTKSEGYCLMTLCHAHHLGRLGHYGQMATDEGLSLFAVSNVTGRPAVVAPCGGAEARLTTNPFCFAWPMNSGHPPLLVDFATSSIAINKARVMAQQGQSVPLGTVIDAQGNPSEDPGVLFSEAAGALLPFGGHKGFGMALMIELMAGILSGGDTIAQDHSANGSAHNHLFTLLIDPSKFGDVHQTQGKVNEFVEYLLGTKPQAGVDHVIYPGMPEAKQRAAHSESITVSSEFWQWITENYSRKGVDLQEPEMAEA
ncbi:Ldh family oxidoreductase [Vibrio sp. Y2-5]|uniref:Ldh family oxidoreductase n=1 Tax=Vibrio TaxID=662 RepID=UPI00142D42AC|nr:MULTISPECIES: Ldh family oxidoreductase [Vibrio]MBD0787329.1 Ldh family oxidoreductase [Vibrio sp. Y2-5]NIY92678.1 Ldh family oxidoreductase [Vibrio diazotrophicus]NVK05237.1 Ldh family oxidoreductase [Flavobacteriia bacterium]